MIISPDFRTTTMSQHRANGNSYSSAGELSEKSSSNDADSRSVQRRVVRERDASAPVRRSTSSMSPIETLHIVLEVCTSIVWTWALGYKKADRSPNAHVSGICVDLRHAKTMSLVHTCVSMSMQARTLCTRACWWAYVHRPMHPCTPMSLRVQGRCAHVRRWARVHRPKARMHANELACTRSMRAVRRWARVHRPKSTHARQRACVHKAMHGMYRNVHACTRSMRACKPIEPACTGRMHVCTPMSTRAQIDACVYADEHACTRSCTPAKRRAAAQPQWRHERRGQGHRSPATARAGAPDSSGGKYPNGSKRGSGVCPEFRGLAPQPITDLFPINC